MQYYNYIFSNLQTKSNEYFECNEYISPHGLLSVENLI